MPSARECSTPIDRLVLHRDLKPANIFVTADGGVNLLDFGIAKLLARGAFPGTHRPHRDGHAGDDIVRYASPEQVRGDPLSVTSDVYALGVVLYRITDGTLASLTMREAARCMRSPARSARKSRRCRAPWSAKPDQAPCDTATMRPRTPGNDQRRPRRSAGQAAPTARRRPRQNSLEGARQGSSPPLLLGGAVQ